jgi:hypothetical protein
MEKKEEREKRKKEILRKICGKVGWIHPFSI